MSVAGLNSDRLFFQWQPDILIQVGDKVAFIECVENDFASVNHQLELPTQSNQSHSLALQKIEKLLQKITTPSFWKSNWNQIVFWFQAQRSRRLILWGILTAIVLWGISSMILFFNVPNISWQKSISASMILLLGGFGDVFGGLGEDQVPLWVVIFCLSITLISLLFLLGVVGLIADSILSLNFLRKRFLYPPAIILSLSVLADLGNGLPTYYSSFSIKSLLLVHILMIVSLPRKSLGLREILLKNYLIQILVALRAFLR